MDFQEIGTHQQLLARKGFITPFIANKMPQSTDSGNHRGKALNAASALTRFIKESLPSRRKVFFDSRVCRTESALGWVSYMDDCSWYFSRIALGFWVVDQTVIANQPCNL